MTFSELCGLKQESKGAPTPITKVTGKRRNCQGRGDVKANLTGKVTIASDSSAATGTTTPVNQRVVDTRSVSQEGVPVGVGGHVLNWADIGTKAHASVRLTSLLRQMPLRLREGQTKALTCLTLMDEEHRASHGGDGEGRDG